MKTFPGAPPQHHGLGIDGEELPTGHYNPPGQPQLSYRVGVYGTFLEGMRARLLTQTIRRDLGSLRLLSASPLPSEDPSGQSSKPLANLNVADSGDIVNAMLKAWAAVGDVLTFYQERIANEGYWRTATERLSMLALVRTIGYEPSPGLAASTHLAFTLATTPGSPATVVVPPGTAVMSTPVGGQQPQTFETIESVAANVAWNSLPAYIQTDMVQQKIGPHSTEVRLAGNTTRLKPSDPVLLVGDLPAQTDEDVSSTGRWFRLVKSVVPNKGGGYTLVTLEPSDIDTGVDLDTAATLVNPQLFAFRQQASLFGFNAPQWKDVADSIKRKFATTIGGTFFSEDVGNTWRSNNSGLPAGNIRAVAIGRDGSCFAGMAGGAVYRLAQDGTGWKLTSSGLTRSDIYSLTVDELGHIFAGTSGGGVFRSTDNGATWVAVGTVTVKQSKTGLQAVSTKLPTTVVRALVASTDPKSGATVLLAGTDSGVFRALNDFGGWNPCNRGLPNTERESGLTSTVINSLLITDGGNQWYAGTNNGVYRWSHHTLDIAEEWTACNKNLPVDSAGRAVTVLELVAYTMKSNRHRVSQEAKAINCLMAGTNSGVYLYREDLGEWSPANNGLPTLTAPGGGVTTVQVSALAAYTDAQQVTSFFAGTTQGLYLSQDDGANWTPVAAALFQKLFTLSNPSTEIIDALNQREISAELRLQFQLRSFALSSTAAVTSAMEADSKWQIYDSNLKRTLALRIESGALSIYLVNTEVQAVAVNSSGKVITATALNGFAESEWPDFVVESPRIDLVSISKGILPDTYIVLSQPGTTPLDSASPPASPPQSPPDERGAAPEVVVCKVIDSFTAPVSGYTRSSTVTTIETDAGDALSSFNRRTTTVFLQSEDLALFTAQVQQPTFVKGNEVMIAGLDGNFEPGRKIVVSGKRPSAVIVADLGGVVRLVDRDCSSIGPANTDVRALVVDSQNNMLAGTHGSGLLQYVATLADPEWITLNTGSTSANVCVLAFDSFNGNTYAAFEGGELWRASYGAWTSLKLPVTNDVRALAFGPNGQCLAGTDGGGIFRLAVNGSWEPVLAGLSNLHVTSLALGSAGQMFAGTDGGGVFRSLDNGGHWAAVNDGLANLTISALVMGPTNKVYAGTHGGGVFCLTDKADQWRAVNVGLTNRDVSALAVHLPSGNIFAGTAGGGVFRATEADSHWKPLNSGVSNDVRALAISANGDVYAGASNVALMASADRSTFIELENEPVGFALDAKYQADLDLGVMPSDVQKIFAANNESLAKDARLTIQKSGSMWFIASGNDLYLIKKAGAWLNVYRPNYSLQIAAPSAAAASDVAQLAQQWHLLDDSGVPGFITTRVDEISPGPALPQGQTVGELATSQNTQAEPIHRRTIVTLDNHQSLQNIYDAQTVQVYANVATATHGETVHPPEVLGSGNASQPNQSFVLKKPPLTYVQSIHPGLAQSTLSVSVSTAVQEGTPRFEPGSLTSLRRGASSVQWNEVQTLYGADKNGWVYMVRTNEKGQTYVIFGDGLHGARLPSGRENIVASYRSGIGIAGNVDAGKLTLLKSRMAGVRSVTNPTPASGGVDPETMDSSLSLAPATVRTMNRIVSLLDYEDFVGNMPGIGKARVKAFYYANTPMAHITIAASDGSQVDKDSDYYADLIETVGQYSASAQKFQVDSYEPLLFRVSAHVIYDKAQDQADLQASVAAVMAQTFSFANRNFGQDVEASQVIMLIQDISGVVSVNLNALYIVGSSEQLNSRLRAAAARINPVTKMIRPAQLLLLDTHDPLKLTWEATP